MNIERVSRFALGGALALVLAVVGYRYLPARGRDDAPPPASASAAGPEQAIATLESAAAKQRGDPGIWVTLGQAYFTSERFAEAARAYARAAALAPRQAQTWSALGEALVLSDKAVTDDAAHAFHRALEENPKDHRARYFLGVRQDLAGDHRGAIDAWIGLLKDSPPGAPWVGSVRALVEQSAGRYKIDVSGRLPNVAARPSGPQLDGGAIAASAIPGPNAAQIAEAARLSPADQQRLAESMTERLAARLEANPHDLTGWIRLMRARTAQGERAGAVRAWTAGKTAFAADPAAIADLEAAAAALSLTR